MTDEQVVAVMVAIMTASGNEFDCTMQEFVSDSINVLKEARGQLKNSACKDQEPRHD